MPVLVTVVQAETTSRSASHQKELNLDCLFADVVAFVKEVQMFWRRCAMC
ncbi:hypothetical protein [Sodalis-like endosymbiont of Proechinophthirus fluctus]